MLAGRWRGRRRGGSVVSLVGRVGASGPRFGLIGIPFRGLGGGRGSGLIRVVSIGLNYVVWICSFETIIELGL